MSEDSKSGNQAISVT